MRTAETFAREVAETFGVRPRRHGREWRVPCALHEADGKGHNPSLAIWDRAPGVVRWKCMTGCPRDAVRAALKARGVVVPGQGGATAEQQLAAARAKEEGRVQALLKARDAYQTSTDVKAGDPVDRYLKGRGIDLATIPGMSSIRTAVCPVHGGPALLGMIVDLTSLPPNALLHRLLEVPAPAKRATGIMTLSLNEDGTPRLIDGKKFRSIAGTQKGFGVPFGVPGPHLVVAEGVETMLSAMILLEVPFGVAVLSASNMATLAVPEWVEEVIIAEDCDDPGRAAADATLRAMEPFFRVRIEGWRGPDGWDANDELMKRKGLR